MSFKSDTKPYPNNNSHSPSITLPPTLFFPFVVSSFRIFQLQQSTHLSHLPPQNILIYLITLKFTVSFRAFPVTRMATRLATASVEISIHIRNHVKAITWWAVTLFWNRLGTWGQSITSQITMDFRHRYKTQPVNSAVVNMSAYVGSRNIWYSRKES